MSTIAIPGVKLIKNKNGKVIAATLSVKHHAHLLEDMIDGAAMAKARTEKTVPWEQVKAKLEKKFKAKK